MRDEVSDVIFSASVSSGDGVFCEVVVSGDMEVYYNGRRSPRQPARAEHIERRRRDTEALLTKLEALGMRQWERTYGEGASSDPGGWMVLMEVDRRLQRWQGCREYPPRWDEFCDLIEQFTERPFL